MTKQEWIGQQWPSAEKVALRRAVVNLIEQGWREANLTLFTRAAVKLALRDVDTKGMDAAVVREARDL